MAQQKKQFVASMRVECIVSVPLKAQTLEEAAVEAQALTATQCIRPVHGQYFDDFNAPQVSYLSASHVWLS